MRARNQRPTAWRAGLLLRRRGEELHPRRFADLLVLGGAMLGGALGSPLSSGALAGAAYEMTRRRFDPERAMDKIISRAGDCRERPVMTNDEIRELELELELERDKGF